MDIGKNVFVDGIVQGVGFRPFIWKIAHQYSLKGKVYNSSKGVDIFIEGTEYDIEQFLNTLKNDAPPLSKINNVIVQDEPYMGYNNFIIAESKVEEGDTSIISPDVTVCEDCLEDIFDESNSRYLYPFTNCTNCGPRFSIIKDLPYDRPLTSMEPFKMCPHCQKEYDNPADRRFHAQPNGCPICGPQLFVYNRDGAEMSISWHDAWIENITDEKIIALKGIGGFHLACDALSGKATKELRVRKGREKKPFALMVKDLQWVNQYCEISEGERELLESKERPIVLLRVKKEFPTKEYISPDIDTIGVMLPYSPLHYLLFHYVNTPIVLTSANYSNKPMVCENKTALEKLRMYADIFIIHNRDIVNRCDDSVVFHVNNQNIVIRPGRGFAPVNWSVESKNDILACGSDLKNTFALTHGDKLTISQYIGDLEDPDTEISYEKSIQQSLDFYKVTPKLITHDLHPDFHSTRWAEQYISNEDIELKAIQHHFAHCAAGYFEHQLSGKALGFAFDGTGYGSDGTIWGGEVFHFDLVNFERVFHFKSIPLPGGEKAIREPLRFLVAALHEYKLLDQYKKKCTKDIRSKIEVYEQIIAFDMNTPLTSSCGRIFDAVSCLLNLCSRQTFDGEAAMKLESCAYKSYEEKSSLPFIIDKNEINFRDLFDAILTLQNENVVSSIIAARFINTIVEVIYTCSEKLIERFGKIPLVFSGGVFQNRMLLEKMYAHKKYKNYKIYLSSFPNDTGIALGQAVIGLKHLNVKG